MDDFRDLTLSAFLESVSSKTPAPGGGAVASTTGALACALGRMVIAYSIGKKSLIEHQPALEKAASVLQRSTEVLLELALEDALAYALVNELMKLPEGDARREKELPEAIEMALAAPLGVVGAASDVLRLLESLVNVTNRHLHSDLAIAAVLSEAAASSGWWNVRVNLPMLKDEVRAAKVKEQTLKLVNECKHRRERIERAIGGE